MTAFTFLHELFKSVISIEVQKKARRRGAGQVLAGLSYRKSTVKKIAVSCRELKEMRTSSWQPSRIAC